jgi:hypothetical protein
LEEMKFYSLQETFEKVHHGEDCCPGAVSAGGRQWGKQAQEP